MTAGGEIIAVQQFYYNNTQTVLFNHTDASGTSIKNTASNGEAIAVDGYDYSPAELDPLGNNQGLWTPYAEANNNPPPSDNGDVFGLSDESPMTVTGRRASGAIDGMKVPWAMAVQAMESGAAVQCPNNYCGPALAISRLTGRTIQTSPFTAYGSGKSGYWVDEDDPHVKPLYPDEIVIGTRTRFVEASRNSWNLQQGNKIPEDVLTGILKELINISTRTCLDKLDQIFKQAENQTKGTGNEDRAFSSNPLVLFGAMLLQGQGGFYFSDANNGSYNYNTGSGAIGAGNATIIINSANAKSSYSKNDFHSLALKVLAEIVHVAGYKPSYYIGGTFSDVNLAKASHGLGIGVVNFDPPTPGYNDYLLTEYPGDHNLDPDKDSQRGGLWSGYNHRSINRWCK